VILHQCDQGTGEWWELRRGLATASGFSRIVTSKGKLSKQADGYIAELIADIASLNPNFFTSQGTQAMRNGQAAEPEARRWYEMEKNVDVRQVGFCTTDCGRFGCSPDGLVGDDGGLELKCPMLKTHSLWLIKGVIPTEYRAQVHGSLIVTGRKYWDFLSYSPGLEPLLVRVEPDEFTATLKQALEDFWVRFTEAVEKLHPQAAALASWKTWLAKVDSLDAFNAGLPNLKGLNQECKAQAWDLVKGYAANRGWTFDPEFKMFLPENVDADQVEVA
jgi:hypothetical protein